MANESAPIVETIEWIPGEEKFCAVRSGSWWSYIGWVSYQPGIRSWVLRDSINAYRHPIKNDTGGILGIAELGITAGVEWRMSPGVIVMPESSVAFIVPCTDVAYQSIRKAMK